MKYTQEYLQMQKLAGIITEGEYREKLSEEISITGDYNDSDYEGESQTQSRNFLQTAEGKISVQLIQQLVSNEFDSVDLGEVLSKSNFPTTNSFKEAAKAGGLEVSSLGNLDNEGNGDFEVENDNYTDKGAAIAFMRDEFYRVG